MSNASGWEQRRNRIFTRKGGWTIGKGITASGYSLLDELLVDHGLIDVVFLHCTGHLPDPALSRWIEGMFICLSFPDPRIWCNQISALAGNGGCSPTAAVTAGTLASDSTLYGPGSYVQACDFLEQAEQAQADGIELGDFLVSRRKQGNRTTPGFARPIAHGDDRVWAMQQMARELGLEPGPKTRIAEQLGELIGTPGQSAMNLLGYSAAFMMDHGMTLTDIRRVGSLSVMAGTHACYSETADSPRGSFLPLRCDDIEYTGCAPRAFPNRSVPT